MITPPLEERNTDYPTGNLSEFLSDINKPKQDFGVDPNDIDIEEPNDFSDGDIEDDPRERVDIQMKAQAAKSSGKLVATVIDNVLPAGLAFLAGDGDPAAYKADPEDKDELTEALTEYMRLKGGDIPPGMMVLLIVLAIYGSRLPEVLRKRKELKESKQEQQSQPKPITESTDGATQS